MKISQKLVGVKNFHLQEGNSPRGISRDAAFEKANTPKEIKPETIELYKKYINYYRFTCGRQLPASEIDMYDFIIESSSTMAPSSLNVCLSALSRWHQAQGFPDPTQSRKLRLLLKYLRDTDSRKPARTVPLEVMDLIRMDKHLISQIYLDRFIPDLPASINRLGLLRNRSLLLFGFRCALGGTQLVNLRVEDINFIADEGMSVIVDASEGLRVERFIPNSSEHCPVEATRSWINESCLASGPLYRAINRWGDISHKALNSKSIHQILQNIATEACGDTVVSANSLKHGFAKWAASSGLDPKAILEDSGRFKLPIPWGSSI